MQNAVSRDNLTRRALIFMFFITAFMSAHLFRLTQLQLVEGAYNRQLAEQNRVRLVPIPADRGNITDRHGRLLASNQLSRAVYLWPRQQTREQWQATAARLEAILDIPAAEIMGRLEQSGFDSPLPVRISQQLDQTAFVAIAEQSAQLPGVEIVAGSVRYYPHRSLASHVLGYIGEASEADMAANPDYPNGMIVGQMGIERIANAQLEGVWGSRLVEVDARGRESRILGSNPTVGGNPIQLTLDLELQQAAERALNGRRGAVVALDVKTGAVLVLASGPSFDPSIFTRRVTQAEWQRLQEGDQPFLNRALQTYPPGSTFKVVTATAGMESGHFSPNSTIGTSAFISLGGIQFWEHSKHGYGAIGFRKALAVSSNTFFYQIGLRVGPEAISKWGRLLGIGTTSNMGLDGGSHGLLPTPQDKEELYGEPWYGGDTVSMSIGQGVVQVTPLELAVMASTIANGGQRVHPHLLASETNTPAMQPEATGIKPGTINAIRSGMTAAVQEGTARRLNDGSIPLTAGKTGTAEVVGRKPHALFVGYGPASDPQIAIAVIVENGGYGGVAALPIAHEIYKAYFDRD
ncbi:penicillin-binding protein 2 [Oscillatoria sp. FACHB-1407]|uniref:penicillin-binding protein 2 n=1 Tax=Oscillatoria sp. FACHB-1407 TaxID=2692847 RepID=UPI0021072E3E|nr:penicillin-binding protein 2 [Oscillatoria sp. FACHB-1407]